MKNDDSAGSTYDEPPLAAVLAFTDFPFTPLEDFKVGRAR